jgi:hypothetical protein
LLPIWGNLVAYYKGEHVEIENTSKLNFASSNLQDHTVVTTHYENKWWWTNIAREEENVIISKNTLEISYIREFRKSRDFSCNRAKDKRDHPLAWFQRSGTIIRNPRKEDPCDILQRDPIFFSLLRTSRPRGKRATIEATTRRKEEQKDRLPIGSIKPAAAWLLP